MRVASLILCAIFSVGCGYKTASHYARETLGDTIFADIQINRDDPQSAPIFIDALNEAIVSRFGKRLVSREEADTIIEITDGTYSVASLQKDADGFVILYRASVSMNAVVNGDKLKNRRFTVQGERDFAVEPSSVVSDAAKNAAAREAALRALDMLIANIMLLGR
ncbi:MAG: LPS assembly lipoprotein LptE [Helicobacteraceae bacterium]|jgi:hypothetical protein|nr:LPS assembly lipoprotein LptE [Helicobacteraceae bacterium]